MCVSPDYFVMSSSSSKRNYVFWELGFEFEDQKCVKQILQLVSTNPSGFFAVPQIFNKKALTFSNVGHCLLIIPRHWNYGHWQVVEIWVQGQDLGK